MLRFLAQNSQGRSFKERPHPFLAFLHHWPFVNNFLGKSRRRGDGARRHHRWRLGKNYRGVDHKNGWKCVKATMMKPSYFRLQQMAWLQLCCSISFAIRDRNRTCSEILWTARLHPKIQNPVPDITYRGLIGYEGPSLPVLCVLCAPLWLKNPGNKQPRWPQEITKCTKKVWPALILKPPRMARPGSQEVGFGVRDFSVQRSAFGVSLPSAGGLA